MNGVLVDVISSINVLIYCDLITPQIVGTEKVRLLRIIICPTQLGNHLFQNVYYIPVEKTHFQDIRIELRETDGGPAALQASVVTTKVVLYFRRIKIHLMSALFFHSSFMHPLTRYYIHQAGGAGGSGVGPIYSLPPYVQRGHGIGDYLGPLFRAIKPWFFSGAKSAGKALGRVALRTGVQILSEIADNPAGYKDIISKHVQDTIRNLPTRMAGGGLKRKRRPPTRTKRPAAKRRRRALSTRRKPKGKPKRRRGPKRRTPSGIKRDIFA